jgi:PPIC-type PPIASE domain
MNLDVSRCGAVLLVALAGACSSAAPNPDASNQPSPWQPPEKKTAPATATDASHASTPSDVTQAPAPAAPAKNESTDPIIASVAGRPIHVSELLVQWMFLDSLQMKELMDNLVLGRLFLAEAQRLGIVIDQDRASQGYESAVKALEEQIQRKRPNTSLDRYVERVLGLDPIRYRERLRDDAVRQLLGERVMRSWLLSTEHAHIRVIVVKTEEDVKAVQADLAAGLAFEEIAKKRSADEQSAKDGGRYPPIVKGDTPIGRMAFEVKEGDVAGPKYDRGAWLFVRVEKRPAPLSGDWKTIGPDVEASLAVMPIDGLELPQWQSAMLERYQVDTKPFVTLLGQNK